MDYRVFEQRLLDTIFTTDVQLSPATIAFLYKLQVQEASDLLQQAAVAGLLNIESDDEGNIIYVYPNRVKMPGGKVEKSSTNGTGVSSGSSETALATTVSTVAQARTRPAIPMLPRASRSISMPAPPATAAAPNLC